MSYYTFNILHTLDKSIATSVKNRKSTFSAIIVDLVKFTKQKGPSCPFHEITRSQVTFVMEGVCSGDIMRLLYCPEHCGICRTFCPKHFPDTFHKPFQPLVAPSKGFRNLCALMFPSPCMKTIRLSSSILSRRISAEFYQIEHLLSH